jgi:uridine kinase
VSPKRVTGADAIAAVVSLVAGQPDRTVFVGIDGRGASGKSTLADQAAAAVAGSAVVHVDDFWGPSIAEWDWDRFRAQVLVPLLAGRPARYQVWEWERDTGGRWIDVPPGGLVLVEGVSCTRAEAGVPWSLQIWVDAPREVRLARALQRDGPERMRRWLEDWMPSEEAYVARERPQDRVDLIVDGTL